MNVKTELKNVKLIKEVEAEFEQGNLYFVRGSNEVGKTTFTSAVLSLFTGDTNKDDLSHGAEKGHTEGTITGMDGKTYKVIINHKKDKNASFTIIYPDLRKSSRKGDLDSIFRYQGVNTETFAGWGLTTDGRRKQAEMFLQLMPAKIVTEVNRLDGLINTRNGEYYIGRRDAQNRIKYFIENNVVEEVTDNDKEIGKLYKQWNESYQESLDDYNADKKDLDMWAKDILKYKLAIENLAGEKDRLLQRLEQIDKELILLSKGFESDKPIHTEESLAKRFEKLAEDNNAVQDAANAARRVMAAEGYTTKIKSLENACDLVEGNLIKARELKEKLIEENLNMKHIHIEDSMLHFKDDEGNLFPITEKSLSYSRIAMIVADLTLKLNPNYPIVCLGKSSEFDPTSIKKLVNYAENTNSIIILDYVDGSGELKIECYEN